MVDVWLRFPDECNDCWVQLAGVPCVGDCVEISGDIFRISEVTYSGLTVTLKVYPIAAIIEEPPDNQKQAGHISNPPEGMVKSPAPPAPLKP